MVGHRIKLTYAMSFDKELLLLMNIKLFTYVHESTSITTSRDTTILKHEDACNIGSECAIMLKTHTPIDLN